MWERIREADGGGEFEEEDDESSNLSPAEKRAQDAERRAEWRKARLRSLENVSSFGTGAAVYYNLCGMKRAGACCVKCYELICSQESYESYEFQCNIHQIRGILGYVSIRNILYISVPFLDIKLRVSYLPDGPGACCIKCYV